MPQVFWKPSSGGHRSNTTASSDTYTREDLCGGVANSTGFIDPGWFHTAKLTGLQPSTEYTYFYGDEVRCHVSAGMTNSSTACWRQACTPMHSANCQFVQKEARF